jgi:hypothetical protein
VCLGSDERSSTVWHWSLVVESAVESRMLQAEAALASARERLQHFQWSYEGQ